MSTPSKPRMSEFQTGRLQSTSERGYVEELFGKQKAYFGTDVTKTYEWRVDQLDRLVRMLKENFERFAGASCKDFKTAAQENVFEVSASIATSEFTKSQLTEWMKPVEAPLPKFLAASGHKGIVYREPYGVALIICPFNVDESANLPDAAKKIVWGAMAWGGQWCTSPGYAVVHESVAEEFVAECKKAVVELYGTDPKSNSDYSRIISAAAVERLASLIDPKKVVYGGEFDALARYLDPTILYPVTWSDKIMEDEIFGPLLPLLTYADLGTLLAKIKSLPKPLAGYVFSRNQRAIDRLLQSLSFGGGAVNQTNVFLFIESMPYGGVGTSGVGNYYGKYGYDSLTHAKSVLISPPDVTIDHLFPPYTKEKVQALDQWFEY